MNSDHAACRRQGLCGEAVHGVDQTPDVIAQKRIRLECFTACDIREKGRKQLSSLLPEYLPASLAKAFPQIAGLDGTKQLSQLTGSERGQVADTLKRLPLHLTGPGPLAEAVVTRGGVSVRDINPSTMASKRVEGLYFAGEIIDVDALTGGFNLQIAFSTGALAGASAAGMLKKKP